MTAYVVSATRTPIGGFGGALAALTAPALGATALRAAVERARLPVEAVEQVIMGNVIAAGLGQAPARQAGLGAGLPRAHGALTVNKVCGSGLMAVMLAAQAIRLGEAEVIAAGGMESMSGAPYLLPRARFGHRLGPGPALDAMITDGLWDPYHDFHMGNAAERCARERAIGREAQDRFAAESYRRAQAAIAAGRFREEIVAVEVPGRGGQMVTIDTDEGPARADFARMGQLRPAFEAGGTITAANASRRGRASWPRPSPPGSRRSSRSRPSTRSGACSSARASPSPTSTSSRSTKRSRWSCWRRSPRSISTRRASTCTAARSRWAIPSGRAGRACW